jgi:N-methylhydantoinase A
MLMADVRRDYVLTHFARLADLDMTELEGRYRTLEEEGLEELRRLGIGPDRIVFERAADLRYVGQEHAVAVPVPASLSSSAPDPRSASPSATRTGDETARDAIKQAFDDAHAVRFSHSAPNEPAELVSLRVSVFGRMDKPGLPAIAAGETAPPAEARRGSRVIVVDNEAVSCGVFDRSRLLAGNEVRGPAVVEEAASSTLLRAGDRAVVSEWGHLLLQLRELQ